MLLNVPASLGLLRATYSSNLDERTDLQFNLILARIGQSNLWAQPHMLSSSRSVEAESRLNILRQMKLVVAWY